MSACSAIIKQHVGLVVSGFWQFLEKNRASFTQPSLQLSILYFKLDEIPRQH